MLITPVTVPPPPQSPSQPEAVANGLHNVQVQSAAPITPNAVKPPPKGEKGEKSKERRKEGRHPSHDQGEHTPDQEAQGRGENINLSV